MKVIRISKHATLGKNVKHTHGHIHKMHRKDNISTLAMVIRNDRKVT